MALTTTSLSAALPAASLIVPVTSATGATVGGFLKVDDEYMVITEINGTRMTVRSRGDYASAAAAHNILAPVTFGLWSDLPQPGPTHVVPGLDAAALTSVGTDGAIDVASLVENTTIVVTKATAAALTLAAPSRAQDGLVVTILSATAAAHTVTYTPGFYGDTTLSDVATFAAKAGASMTIVARGGTWGVQALANVTLA